MRDRTCYLHARFMQYSTELLPDSFLYLLLDPAINTRRFAAQQPLKYILVPLETPPSIEKH